MSVKLERKTGNNNAGLEESERKCSKKAAMVKLTGYEILTQIYAGTRTLVYRGIRESDNIPVVIKLLRSEYPLFHELAQFRNQYTIAKHLQMDGVIQTYSLENYHNGYALVMEDFGGISLKEEIGRWSEDLPGFFAIGLQIVNSLDALYRQRVIHKDIKPANILINYHTRQVKLIDFSIASLLPRETQHLGKENVLEGTLAYLSPEQTGRMNRVIDYRTDFYSLGVTFYELLTGQLPFTTTDPMELVHCHIAKQPPSVHSINPTIPPILSLLISKLMAKNAEDRYQSALGLKHDLEYLQQDVVNESKIFALGQKDFCERFIIPEKLYGRSQEVETLLAAFDRVAGIVASALPGHSELILIAGFSGIGKTAVVNEIHKPIARQGGYFIKGKYNQFGRNTPFLAFVHALQDLMGQLLSETDTQLEKWKTNILLALGFQAQIIIDVIPELEWIIGQQPPAPKLSASADQNRFNLLFGKFIQVFATPKHPLVMFLDDLQWADSASLQLIQLLMEDDTRNLLLIGAYRDNEVNSSHPLMLTILDIWRAETTINTINLNPLQPVDLNLLIADTLNCKNAIAVPLAELVYQKTQGNPFFVNRFLQSLYADKLIHFNSELGGWECDISQIKALALSDDIVEFIALQLKNLPIATQFVLKLAACIGNSFDLKTLAIVSESSLEQTATDLWEALSEGLILPISEVYKFFQHPLPHSATLLPPSPTPPVNYKFLHDRVQQAAYSLIPQEEKKSTHLQIGQILLINTPQKERGKMIFEIVNQLNMGIELITQTQRTELAHLNLIAGRKAKAATAYAAALEYLNTGRSLVDWQDYDLTLQLYLETAEAAYLNTDFEQSSLLGEVIWQQVKNLTDKVKVCELKIQIYIAQNQPTQAIAIGLETLEMLGVTLSTVNNGMSVELPKISDLPNFPQMSDPAKLAAMRILGTIVPATYVVNRDIWQQVILTMINLSSEGHSAQSAYAYVAYGSFLCGVLGNIDAAYYSGQLALLLLNNLDGNALYCKINFVFNALIRHGKEHIKATIHPLQSGIQNGLDNGDITFAGLSASNFCGHLFFVGEQLNSLLEQQARYIHLLLNLKQEFPIYIVRIWRQLVLILTDSVDENSIEKEEIFTYLSTTKNQTVLFYAYVAQEILDYLVLNDGAIDSANRAEKYVNSGAGLILVPIHKFYFSLICLARYPHVSITEQAQLLQQVAINQETLELWACQAPMNYQHKYDLVVAETARILDQPLQAMADYDRAISGALANGYLQEAALANEIAAEFYLAWGKEKIAQVYLTDAYYGYARWGASAKVKQIEKRHSQLLTSFQQEKVRLHSGDTHLSSQNAPLSVQLTVQTISSQSSSTVRVLDLATIIKASQALSREIELSKLLSTLMQVVMENAGAHKGALILVQDCSLVIAATAVVGADQINTVVLEQLVESSQEIPVTLINYVSRTQETLAIDDATANQWQTKSKAGSSSNIFCLLPSTLENDPYIIRQQPKSLLCTPILNQGKLLGLLYLENNLSIGAFTSNRVEVLHFLCSQVAISLENARLYQQSQAYSQKLEQSLQQLQQAQLQLVQGEKMSSLGNLVAGIAHEINNPVGFIASNIAHTQAYVQDLIGHLQYYQEKFPQPGDEITGNAEAIYLDFLIEDLPSTLSSMKVGTDRIRNISTSLRTFSRSDTVEKVAFNLHEGIDSTLLILKYRLQSQQEKRSEIKVIKDYGDLPQVECFPGQLNQVFMNILANAIDVLEAGTVLKPQICIRTEVLTAQQVLAIHFQDNGCGMSESVRSKIFDHLFTTKAVGKGTGLGLSIARQIIEDTHGGKLSCISAPGKGTEFVIQIPL